VPEPADLSTPVLGTLSGLGVEVDEVEAAVISSLLEGFDPAIRALMEADLADVGPEVDCDPSIAPEPPQ
jgi:hypothetical protein